MSSTKGRQTGPKSHQRLDSERVKASAKESSQHQLDVRRKLEDRLERKRLEDELGCENLEELDF